MVMSLRDVDSSDTENLAIGGVLVAAADVNGEERTSAG
jgi:hypothetical protein